MIKQYRIEVSSRPESHFVWHWGYLFYGMLSEELNPDFAQTLHNDGLTPIVQHLKPNKERNGATWVVNLLGEEAIEQVSPILDRKTDFFMKDHGLEMLLGERNSAVYPDARTLIQNAQKQLQSSSFTLSFQTPTSFKRDNKYQIFPSESLILQSLANKWNAFESDMRVDDQDALDAILYGLRIRDYKLSSRTYQMKGTSIPGFAGEVTLSAKLAPPLMEVWRMLLYYSQFCGVGIKSSLGMGAVTVSVPHGANPK